MKKALSILFTVLLIALLASCTTAKAVSEIPVEPVPTIEPYPEPIPSPEPSPEPEPEPKADAPEYNVGQTGPDGGTVFFADGQYLEYGAFIGETSSYDAALAWVEEFSTERAIPYRLPSVDELLAIYNDLVMTERIEIDWTYYWSCEQNPDGTVTIVNFDTGFEGMFFKDMDFVGAIAVRAL